MKRPVHASDLRAYSRLAVEATLGVTDLVEAVHRSVLSLPGRGAKPQRTRGLTGFIYRAIRWVTRRVGSGLDTGLTQLTPLLASSSADAPPAREREALVAVLNGVLGDHLEATGNALAIPMRFRRDGRAFDPAVDPTQERGSRILLLLHGLCCNDLQWSRRGHDHGARLAADLGYTPIYLHYNTGRPIATNGAELSRRLDQLFQAWPGPVTELTVLAHSMGGLVMRSACEAAEESGSSWRGRLRRIVFLGTPHQGSPLERGGHWLNRVLDTTSYTAAFGHLGRLRSAGITDLRHGLSSRLPADVDCFVAAALLGKPGDTRGSLLGDGLVPLASAFGDHADPARSLGIAPDRRWVGEGMGHLDLLDRPEVYRQIHAWLSPPA
jgi:hypothetical protein